MGAAVLCTGILLIPAAIGIPFIGVAPLRYIYMPMALFLTVSAATWPDAPRKRGSFMVFLFCALCAPTTAMRVSDFDNDLSLWSAELSAEPQNPYAAGSLARALIANNQADEGIAMWSEAIEKAPSGIRVFDRANEQWLLAQTAFMKGHPGTGLKQVTNLIDEAHQAGTTPPVMAHCLKADSLDALGRNDEASVAAKLCR